MKSDACITKETERTRMQRDNQGRALLRLPTTMRLAFAAALDEGFARDLAAARDGRVDPNFRTISAVASSIRSNHGYIKVPAWTVTRKGGKR